MRERKMWKNWVLAKLLFDEVGGLGGLYERHPKLREHHMEILGLLRCIVPPKSDNIYTEAATDLAMALDCPEAELFPDYFYATASDRPELSEDDVDLVETCFADMDRRVLHKHLRNAIA